MATRWKKILLCFVLVVGDLYVVTQFTAESHRLLWALGIGVAIFAVIGIGNTTLNYYIRHARSIFE